jgi:hypothetical protein
MSISGSIDTISFINSNSHHSLTQLSGGEMALSGKSGDDNTTNTNTTQQTTKKGNKDLPSPTRGRSPLVPEFLRGMPLFPEALQTDEKVKGWTQRVAGVAESEQLASEHHKGSSESNTSNVDGSPTFRSGSSRSPSNKSKGDQGINGELLSSFRSIEDEYAQSTYIALVGSSSFDSFGSFDNSLNDQLNDKSMINLSRPVTPDGGGRSRSSSGGGITGTRRSGSGSGSGKKPPKRKSLTPESVRSISPHTSSTLACMSFDSTCLGSYSIDDVVVGVPVKVPSANSMTQESSQINSYGSYGSDSRAGMIPEQEYLKL